MFPSAVEPLKTRRSTAPEKSASGTGAGGVSDTNETLPYTNSSFAPSNKAAERKAKAKAQKDAHLAAVHKPGRANGKKKKTSMVGGWDSSEEEDEDEEEDDDDVDSDGGRRADSGLKGQQQLQSGLSGSALSSAHGHGRPGLQIQPVSGGIGGDPSEVLTPSQLRPSRNLPQIPGGRNLGEF
jgi:CCR4-NOT transcriptional complex subunit CAF120